MLMFKSRFVAFVLMCNTVWLALLWSQDPPEYEEGRFS